MYRPGLISLIILLVIICTTYTSCKDDQDEGIYEENLFIWIEWSNKGMDTTTYFVLGNGDDNNNGTSVNTAFRTLAKALQKVHEGGRIRILPGTYTEAIVLLNCKVQEEIIIEGHDGMPIFDGNQSLPAALFFENCSNLSISGIGFENYTDFGTGASFCQNLKFRNLSLKNNGHKTQLTDWETEGYGLYLDKSADILVEDCEAFKNGPDPKVFPDRLLGTGIDTYKLKNSIIRNNNSHHNNGGGILVEDGINVIVEGNEVHHNDLDASIDGWWDGGLWVDGGHDIFVRNNNFDDNIGPGIEISDEDNQYPTGYVLENNLSNNNYYGILIWNFGTNNWPDTSILVRINNDFTDNQQKDVWIIP